MPTNNRHPQKSQGDDGRIAAYQIGDGRLVLADEEQALGWIESDLAVDLEAYR